MSFDVSAEAYDRFMGRYSLLLSPQLADLAFLAPTVKLSGGDGEAGRSPGRLIPCD